MWHWMLTYITGPSRLLKNRPKQIFHKYISTTKAQRSIDLAKSINFFTSVQCWSWSLCPIVHSNKIGWRTSAYAKSKIGSPQRGKWLLLRGLWCLARQFIRDNWIWNQYFDFTISISIKGPLLTCILIASFNMYVCLLILVPIEYTFNINSSVCIASCVLHTLFDVVTLTHIADDGVNAGEMSDKTSGFSWGNNLCVFNRSRVFLFKCSG